MFNGNSRRLLQSLMTQNVNQIFFALLNFSSVVGDDFFSILFFEQLAMSLIIKFRFQMRNFSISVDAVDLDLFYYARFVYDEELLAKSSSSCFGFALWNRRHQHLQNLREKGETFAIDFRNLIFKPQYATISMSFPSKLSMMIEIVAPTAAIEFQVSTPQSHRLVAINFSLPLKQKCI